MTLKIEMQFLQAKLEKIIANVKHKLKTKSLATLKEPQSLLHLLLFIAEIVILGLVFVHCFH